MQVVEQRVEAVLIPTIYYELERYKELGLEVKAIRVHYQDYDELVRYFMRPDSNDLEKQNPAKPISKPVGREQ